MMVLLLVLVLVMACVGGCGDGIDGDSDRCDGDGGDESTRHLRGIAASNVKQEGHVFKVTTRSYGGHVSEDLKRKQVKTSRCVWPGGS